MRSLLAGALLALFACGSAMAQNLDAPLVPKPPTIRSELVRGGYDADKCTEQYVIQFILERRCIESAQSLNRRSMGQGFEAYEAGLFFSTWKAAHINTTTVVENPQSYGDPSDARENEGYYWRRYVNARKGVGIRDQDVVEALNLRGPIYDYIADAVSRFGN